MTFYEENKKLGLVTFSFSSISTEANVDFLISIIYEISNLQATLKHLWKTLANM